MAKVIFEFTENDATPGDKSGCFSIPVAISVGVDGLNDERPGHSECLAVIMKNHAPAIIKAVNEAYMHQLKASGGLKVSSEFFKVKTQKGDKNVH